ncbi:MULTISPECIES: CsbD family protein [unclassified Methylobacterium]|uniref:CsbD family protein n=1 Tax=unclassified Methylobacterium TaxID=2615210 RepID=UPI000152E206|nr:MULTISPECIES: CsbD family protein [Methylobacterium]WFT81974.1 CsbD family protein [Methylobacterium nodulans]
MADEAAGHAKQGIDGLTGDRKLQAEGRAQELKGRALKGLGEAKDAVEAIRETF